MSDSYDLTKLNAQEFEHLVNSLAITVLGAGHTGFGPGSDGGRDGFFEGEAPYPSQTERWSGRWYIQSKFHAPHLSKNPHEWLLQQIQLELNEFKRPRSKRKWPDNWIVATNIDPSGVPETGSFDAAKKLVAEAHPALAEQFHIWGGRKILDLLSLQPRVAERYSHFLTPGHVITALYQNLEGLQDAQAQIKDIVRFLIVRQFEDQQHTKLEQAGSATDVRPGIHNLFIDLPFRARLRLARQNTEPRFAETVVDGLVMEFLTRASAQNHRPSQRDGQDHSDEWRVWHQHPARGRVWFVKGGPGQGKSTIGQYFCQIQRANLLLQGDNFRTYWKARQTAGDVKRVAEQAGLWPVAPRIPVAVELKDYAQWLGARPEGEARGLLTYLSLRIGAGVEQTVLPGTLKRALAQQSWFFAFDGLDEVPQDVKDLVASEVRYFVDDVAVEADADLLAFCTSRPQGYSGQFGDVDGPTISLSHLSPEQALACAEPVVAMERSSNETANAMDILRTATLAEASAVRELMTTPLQAHIMAVVVRDGQRPPERRWKLFSNFYEVIRRREANRNLPDPRLNRLLREDEQLLKTVHSRLGFVLHAQAETSQGALAQLSRADFEILVREAATKMIEENIEETVDVLMQATTNRLVLVNTPENGEFVRFDIRPLQEFFAAEFLYESVDAHTLRSRLQLLAGDAHWREVTHFLLSALVENNRQTELAVAVSVLESVNRGDGASDSNEEEQRNFELLHWRLGRGALLVARLLQEGVLEQDKRTRQMFRNCLNPLPAFTSNRALESFLDVSGQQSKGWLCHYLVDWLKQSNPSESLGAAFVLAHLVDDENSLAHEIYALLQEWPPSHLAWVFDRCDSTAYTEDEEEDDAWVAPDWLVNLALDLLLRREWKSLTVEELRATLRLLRRSNETVRLALEFGLSLEQVDLLLVMIEEDLDYSYPSSSQEPQDYGVVLVDFFEADWTHAATTPSAWNPDLFEIAEALGVLQWGLCLLRFGVTKNLKDLTALLDVVGQEHFGLLGSLPRRLQALIPLPTWDDFTLAEWPRHFDRLRSLNEEELEKLLNTRVLNGQILSRPWETIELRSPTENQCSVEQWNAFMNQHPSYALTWWTDRFLSSNLSRPISPDHPWVVLDQPEVENSVLEELLRRPSTLLSMPLRWGTLLQHFVHRQEELRRAIIEATHAPVEKYPSISRGISTFSLDLPDEASIVPHLTHALMWLAFNAVHSPFRTGDDETEGLKHLLGDFTKRFVEDPQRLLRLAQDGTLPVGTRACAAMLLLLHPAGAERLDSWKDLMVEACQMKDSSWIVFVVLRFVGFMASEEDAAARWIVAQLLELGRHSPEHNTQIQWLLQSWRESSHAPVQTKGIQSQWLSQS